jgi:RNA polymerase sigma-70 factor, ECF subfamily
MHAPSEQRHQHLANLLAASAARDEAAFRALHALTHDYLHHVALRVLGSPSLAEEALQEAYLNIWLHAASFRRGDGSPMTWLIAIVRHRALSQLRSIPRSTEAEVDDVAEAEASDPVGYGGLQRALARLEPPQRQSIALAFGRDMTHAEVARHLGVPLGTAKSWLRRGLERLRNCLEPPGATAKPARPMLAGTRP